MGFLYEERNSDSPYVETVTRGRSVGLGSTIRPAEYRWHLVLVRHNGNTQVLMVGPQSSSGVVSFIEGLDLLWIRLSLGTFMPHLPTRQLVDAETSLPLAAGEAFWLKGSTWQFPDFENADTFVNRLARADVLAHDPLIEAALEGKARELSPRTLRYHFTQVTGLTQKQIQQARRAYYAAELLQRGVPILDTVFEAGYFDQPHLTRALKQWIGHTPAQLQQTAA